MSIWPLADGQMTAVLASDGVGTSGVAAGSSSPNITRSCRAESSPMVSALSRAVICASRPVAATGNPSHAFKQSCKGRVGLNHVTVEFSMPL